VLACRLAAVVWIKRAPRILRSAALANVD